MAQINLAQGFFDRFAGLSRAHGFYDVTGSLPNDKGKIEGNRHTKHEPPTVDHWAKHLKGPWGIGIVPIRDDATVVFGAIDIDVYKNFEVMGPKLEAECKRLGLPLIVCRTKSGGVHLYLFTSEPVSASLVYDKLKEWSVALGYPGVEIFPKQTRLANNENDYGNWINMPYQGGPKTSRFAILDGKAIGPEAFLILAEEMSVSGDELKGIDPATDPTLDDYFNGSPPCLQVLAARGFPQGTRNNALFNIAVYLRKRFTDDWQLRVQALNAKFMDPPLPEREVTILVKSMEKKNYSYKCKDQPICDVCDRSVCLKREFGVKGGNSNPGVEFGPLLKIETTPPTWIWSVNGARIELQTEDLIDQRRFQKRAVEELNVVSALVKPNVWSEILQGVLANVEIVEVPEDATKEGQLWVHLQRFCTSRVQGKSLDELLLKKPFTDGDKTYFVSSDFLEYLQQHRVTGIDEKRLFTWLRERGVDHHTKPIKGKLTNYWSVNKFSEQTEEFSVPRTQSNEAM